MLCSRIRAGLARIICFQAEAKRGAKPPLGSDESFIRGKHRLQLTDHDVVEHPHSQRQHILQTLHDLTICRQLLGLEHAKHARALDCENGVIRYREQQTRPTGPLFSSEFKKGKDIANVLEYSAEITTKLA